MPFLVSKLAAGGLSASVVLLWWPLFFQTDTVTSWLARGVCWTLMFELLVFALRPLENALWDTSPARRVRHKASAAGARINSGSPRRRLGATAVVAALGLALPLTAISVGLQERLPSLSQSEPERVEVTKVVRVVKEQERRSRERAPASTAPTQTPARPSGTAAPSSTQTGPGNRSTERRPAGRAGTRERREPAEPRRTREPQRPQRESSPADPPGDADQDEPSADPASA